MVPIAKAGILTVLIGGGCVGTYALANGGFGSKRGNGETAKADVSENKGQNAQEPVQATAKEGPADNVPASDSDRDVKTAPVPNVVTTEESAFKDEPAWKPLTQDSNYKTKKESDYKDKFGSIYGNYFVGLDGANKDWWDKAFEKLQADSGSPNASLGTKFKYVADDSNSPITKAFSDALEEKGLNQICNEVYKSDPKNITADGDTDNYKESDVWKYCSPLGKEPEAVKSGQYTDQVGSTSGANFASVEKGVNDLFWTIRQKEIRGDNNFEKITISNSGSDTHFNSTTKSLRELCGKAYEQPNGSGSQPNPTAETTKKYCAIVIPQS